MIDLSKLSDPEIRKAILLAELAAWLHDMGKCADAFLQNGGIGFNANACQGNPRVNPHKAIFSPNELAHLTYWNTLSPSRGQCARREEAKHTTALWRTLQRLQLSMPSWQIQLCTNISISLKEIILWGRPLVADRHSNFQRIFGADLTYLSGILGKVHSVAHIEKEDIADGGQSESIETTFGFKLTSFHNLDDKLKSVFQEFSETHKNRILKIKENFITVPGDTRRPINEVTLWDWSSIVAALYKTELARCVVTGEQRQPNQTAWRLLSVRTDGLSYLLGASSIPDLLARKELLTDGWNRVQKLLEESYPLGLEVYRDENGPLFVVPDIENMTLALVDSSINKNLHKLIIENFTQGTVKNDQRLCISGEVVPHIHPDEQPWNGQLPDGLPPVGQHLKRSVQLTADPDAIADTWCANSTDICSVCGLRPQGPDKKAISRNVCNICEKRRADRSKEWATEKLDATIWIDEVADRNGRIALITGNFDLTHWLSGHLVRSLAVRQPDDQHGRTADTIAKNPSFARLRRIWETTRRFWQEVAPTDDNRNLKESLIGSKITQRGQRLEIKGNLHHEIPRNTLARYHAYDLVFPRGVRLSMVWDAGKRRFIVNDNLEYIGGKNQLGQPVEDVLREGESFEIEEASGYGVSLRKWGTITLTEDAKETSGSEYIPAVPILAEPRTFMALVPADKALEIVSAIKTKYEREMGKVRNRLPLHLGIIFSGRRTPLRAIMDAGRQMLKQKAEASCWKVISCQQSTNLPPRFTADQNGQFAKWFEVLLEKEERQITWYVPAMMGDGQTKDHWYPYIFLKTNTEPTGRQKYFKATNPWTNSEEWLVHAGELKPGDSVYFTPSTFDFEFLDTTARRFEIHYDEKGRRTTRRTRPYYLEDLNRLEKLWNSMKRLSTNQRYQVIRTIESTREMWFGQDKNGESATDETFRQFVADTLASAEWPKENRWSTIELTWQKELIQAGIRGELADLLELHEEIMKAKA